MLSILSPLKVSYVMIKKPNKDLKQNASKTDYIIGESS